MVNKVKSITKKCILSFAQILKLVTAFKQRLRKVKPKKMPETIGQTKVQQPAATDKTENLES